MKKGDRFIYKRTNEEVVFVNKKGMEFTFKYVNPNGKKPFICFIGGNPLSTGSIIPIP